ncbi:unnamed protein product, partial [Closterium sp. NIES-65]
TIHPGRQQPSLTRHASFAPMVDVVCERVKKVNLDVRKAHAISAFQAAASVAAVFGKCCTDKAALTRRAEQEKLLRNALATSE